MDISILLKKSSLTAVSIFIVMSLLVAGLITVASEEPPLEESVGLSVTSNVQTVHPDKEGAWRYRLYLESESQSEVELKKLIIKAYTFKDEYVTERTYGQDKLASLPGGLFLKPGERKNIGFGLSSKSSIYFRDHIFIGVTEEGKEVKGTCRVNFSKEEKEREGPPKEEELLDRSKGINVTVNKETVHPDEEGMWRYRLRIEPSDDFGVTIEKMTTKAYLYDGRYLTEETHQKDDFKEWWGSSYIKLGESRSFGSGLPSKNDIRFRDHIFTGVNDIGEEVIGTIRVHFSKEKKETATEEASLWEKKWSQQPDQEHTSRRVDSPKDYDVQGLRVNADFKVDLSEWYDDLNPETYWVPAASLGTPDNTKDEILSLKGKPEKAKREINVLFEALSFIHLATEPNIHNAKTEGKRGIRWGFPKPAKPSIRDGTVNCASAANIIRYLLEDDYEEIGYVWRHSAFDAEQVGGHCTSYIKYEGRYFFFDPVSLAEDKSKYPVEDGDGKGYQVDRADYLIQSKPENYLIYWSQISRNDEAIFAMFQCQDNHFALGSKDGNLYYPMDFDPANLTIWEDPQDSVQLIQANYSPKPPKDQYGVKDYAEYMPFSSYLKPWEWNVEDQGQAKILKMKSDG